MTIIRGANITRPATTAPKSTLLDRAKVATVSGAFGLQNDAGGIWPSYNAGLHVVMHDFCEPDDKDFSAPVQATGFTFALQMGWQCKAVGLDTADLNAEAIRVFEAMESKGVETALYERLVNGDLMDEALGTGLTFEQALAALEGSAAATYAGLPTILVSQFGATMLNDRIVWEGDKAYTRSGAKVAIARGFDEEKPSGTTQMLATGEIYVEKAERFDVVTNVIPGDGSAAGSGDGGFTDNTVITMVERLYRVVIDPLRNDGTQVLTALAGTAW